MDRPIIILSFVNYYLPGYKSGGALRTLTNMVEWLGDEIQFKLITRDRDVGDNQPYTEVKIDEWNQIGKCEVFFCSPIMSSLSDIRMLIRNTQHDVLYLNSYFDPLISLKPLLLKKLGLINEKPIVLAPRGEFSKGALKIKSLKKNLFLNIAKLIGLHRNVMWQASSVYEKIDIHTQIGKNAEVFIAPDLPKKITIDTKLKTTVKVPGKLKILFLSRISPMKNLEGAINILNGVNGNINFDIVGPNPDKGYWDKCKTMMKALPSTIKIDYRGSIPNESIIPLIGEYDLLLFPTHGENYGHVIFESLSAGCPVLISDQTPWQNLEEMHAGWVIPLSDISWFRQIINRCLHMDESEHKKWQEGAFRFAKKVVEDQKTLEHNKNMFYSVC